MSDKNALDFLERVVALSKIKLGYNDDEQGHHYALTKCPGGPWEPLTEDETSALTMAPDLVAALQVRLEAAERNEKEAYGLLNNADRRLDEASADLAAAQARIAELEKPVLDEEVVDVLEDIDDAPATDGGRGSRVGAQWLKYVGTLIRRLSRQSKSNALLSKCEEALAMLYAMDRTLPSYAQSNAPVSWAVAKVCDEFLDTSGGLLGRVRERARAILSQIEQSRKE